MDRPAQDRGPRVNERIKIREVRLIDNNGEQHGVVPTERALAMAKAQGLDLVEVADRERPPVCKIMDYGKYKYEQKRKKRENAKKQHKVELKQVRMRPKTGEHDYLVKLKHAERFLKKGCKVQVNVFFRGRERAHTEIARDHLQRMAQELEELAKVEVAPKMEGYRMIMVLSPTPKALKMNRDAREKREKAKSEPSKRSRRVAKLKARDSERLKRLTEPSLEAIEGDEELLDDEIDDDEDEDFEDEDEDEGEGAEETAEASAD
ncbi:MAG: translation initiation factor IF-3 [Planctomycetota bacterium]